MSDDTFLLEQEMKKLRKKVKTVDVSRLDAIDLVLSKRHIKRISKLKVMGLMKTFINRLGLTYS